MKKILAILACSLIAVVNVFAGEYEDISITDLKKAIADKKVVLLDVNGSATYAKNHIPGAIDYRANADKIETLLADKDKDTLVVAYCGNSKCSAYKAGAEKAASLGFKNVKHLSAGIAGWLQAGEATEKAEPKS